MALTNLDQPKEIRPNEGFDENSLKTFLINELNLIEGIIKISQFPSGFSNLTYLVNFNNKDFVLRRPPIGANIKSGHDMNREYTILNGLKKIYNKVPKPYIYSDNLKIIGAPFYLMERKKGIILRGNTPKKQLPDKLDMRKLSKEFIFTLALALKCYPLQPGGLLALEAIIMGLTSTKSVFYEIEYNLEVILLLVFMVAGIYFMKNLMLTIFTRLLLNIKSKTLLSLLFCISAAVLSAFLDALTVTAVLIGVTIGFYRIYHAVA